ncbi:uncharacterized protein [Watersipora subatra]|uniref:uncharacterized protein n=1 Tax=Watersipora subatra TaxID=2589382 RepID=UPI00355BDE53
MEHLPAGVSARVPRVQLKRAKPAVAGTAGEVAELQQEVETLKKSILESDQELKDYKSRNAVLENHLKKIEKEVAALKRMKKRRRTPYLRERKNQEVCRTQRVKV